MVYLPIDIAAKYLQRAKKLIEQEIEFNPEEQLEDGQPVWIKKNDSVWESN